MFARSAARLANLRLSWALQGLRSLTLSPRTAASQAVSLCEALFFASLLFRRGWGIWSQETGENQIPHPLRKQCFLGGGGGCNVSGKNVMSHQFESGFFVRVPAWHRLGTVVQEAPT